MLALPRRPGNSPEVPGTEMACEQRRAKPECVLALARRDNAIGIPKMKENAT